MRVCGRGGEADPAACIPSFFRLPPEDAPPQASYYFESGTVSLTPRGNRSAIFCGSIAGGAHAGPEAIAPTDPKN